MTRPDHDRDQPAGGQSESSGTLRFRQDEVMITSPNAEQHPLARSGTVIVDSGTLSLFGDDDQLIDSTPVEKISTKYAWMWVSPNLWWENKMYRIVMYMGPASGIPAMIVEFRRSKRLYRAIVAGRPGGAG